MPIDIGDGVTLYRRGEWGAKPARSRQSLTVNSVTAHWLGPGIGAVAHSRCASIIRGIQDFHMITRGWQDGAYNAFACQHGYVYEMRGRGVRSAANGTNAGNSSSYAVCYLGGEGDPFTNAGARAMRAAMNWLAAGGRRLWHSYWKATACPGGPIRAWIGRGLPVIGGAPKPLPPPVLPPPKPAPPKPAPDPVLEDDDMTRLYKGDKSNTIYYTDLVWKRPAGTPREVAEDIWIGAVTGHPISTTPAHGPHIRPQAYIDRIPTAGAEGPRDHATELRVIDVRNELDKITDEVRAWQAAVEAG